MSLQTPPPAAAPLASSGSAGRRFGDSFHSSLFGRSSSASPSSCIAASFPGCAHLERSVERVLGSPVSLDIASGPRKGRSQETVDDAQALVLASILCEEEQDEAEREAEKRSSQCEDGRLEEEDYLPIVVRGAAAHDDGDDDESELDDDMRVNSTTTTMSTAPRQRPFRALL